MTIPSIHKFNAKGTDVDHGLTFDLAIYRIQYVRMKTDSNKQKIGIYFQYVCYKCGPSNSQTMCTGTHTTSAKSAAATAAMPKNRYAIEFPLNQ